MTKSELVIAACTVIFGGGLAGGIAAVALLPRQRRQLDALTAQTVVNAATALVDQLQEETQAAKVEAREMKAEAHAARREITRLREEIKVLWKEVEQLSADLADRDRIIAELRRVV